MISRPGLALAISALLLPALAAAAEAGANARSYKWVDDHGVTHYGDAVPPEYAGQGRSELNAQGVAVKQYPRQLSGEEAVVAQKTAAEEAKQRQHDAFLLNTYTKVSDIEQLRDERIGLVDGQILIARGSIESNRQHLAELEKRMRVFRPYSDSPTARRMPDQLAEEIIRALKERDSLHELLASHETQKLAHREQFDADIARYRELTSKHSAP
jgi:hypothetical protein